MTSRSTSSGIASAPNDEAPQKRPRVDGAAPSAVAAAEAKDDEDEEAQPHDTDATRRAATVRLHATSGLSATAAAAAAATAVSASSSSSSSAHAAEERRKCPYLDTVNRHLLDTDMEKVCSVSLSNLHVYACLVCGRFFQGRGKATPAYTHSVQAGHFVFMNLHDARAFCLPDGYEVVDSSLDDVKRSLHPSFAPAEIAALDRNTTLARDVHGNNYLPGFVGLNNLKHTDYVNVVLHALAHVGPIRDFFLQPELYATCRAPLVHRFGEVMRKMWSRHNFKAVVSPQEFVHELSVASKKRFTVGAPADAVELLAWLLGELHRALAVPTTSITTATATATGAGGRRKGGAGAGAAASVSVVSRTFGGLVELTTRTKVTVREREEAARQAQLAAAAAAEDGTDGAMDIAPAPGTTTSTTSNGNGSSGAGGGAEGEGEGDEGEWRDTSATHPFTLLALDIPPMPMFRDSEGGLVIPQLPLFEVLRKFDGRTWTDHVSVDSHVRKRYCLRALPPYLILHLVRFTKNNFLTSEKNRSVVTFPVKNLSLKDYYFPPDDPPTGLPPDPAALASHTVAQLRDVITKYGHTTHLAELPRVVEKPALLALATDAAQWANQARALIAAAKYDLVTSVCHDSSHVQEMAVAVGGAAGAPPPAAAADKQGGKGGAAAGAAGGAAASTGGGAGGAGAYEGHYRVHAQNKATGQWFEMHDLRVTETMPQLVGLSESYILIYERKSQ